MKIKAYSYKRWSSEIQTSGDSLRRQTESARAVCRNHPEWELDETLEVDAAVSSYRGDNLEKGALAAFINSVKLGRIQTPCVLIVDSLDRLTRLKLRFARRKFEEILELGVMICVAKTGKVYTESSLDNVFDLFMILMELDAAHQYAAEIGRKTGEAWKNKKAEAAKGVILTKRTPGWIQVVDGKFELIPERVKLVRKVFNDYVSGEGYRTIAKELNGEGIKPFGHGAAWNVSYIRKLLMSRSVLGEYLPGSYVGKKRTLTGEVVENYYPAIIDIELWHKAQLKMNSKTYIPGPKKHVHNLFSGVMVCAHCGAAMTLKFAGNTGYKQWQGLVCYNATTGSCAHGYHSIHYRPVEKILLSFIADPIVKSLIDTPVEKHSNVTAAEIAETEKKIERLSDRIVNDENAPKSLVKALKDLETNLGVLQERMKKEVLTETHQSIIPEEFDRFMKQLGSLDGRESRLAFRNSVSLFIEQITIDSKERAFTVRFVNKKELQFTLDENDNLGSLNGRSLMEIAKRLKQDTLTPEQVTWYLKGVADTSRKIHLLIAEAKKNQTN